MSMLTSLQRPLLLFDALTFGAAGLTYYIKPEILLQSVTEKTIVLTEDLRVGFHFLSQICIFNAILALAFSSRISKITTQMAAWCSLITAAGLYFFAYLKIDVSSIILNLCIVQHLFQAICFFWSAGTFTLPTRYTRNPLISAGVIASVIIQFLIGLVMFLKPLFIMKHLSTEVETISISLERSIVFNGVWAGWLSVIMMELGALSHPTFENLIGLGVANLYSFFVYLGLFNHAFLIPVALLSLSFGCLSIYEAFQISKPIKTKATEKITSRA